MQTSWLPVTYFKEIIAGILSPEDWMKRARALGLDAVDASCLFFNGPGRLDPGLFRAAADRHGLAVAVFNTYPDFTHPDPDRRLLARAEFAGHAALAARIGARMIRVTAGQAHPETDRASGVRWAVEGLRQAAEVAERLGLRAVYENHSKPGVWHYADFAHPADVFLEIAEALRGLPLGILYDTANAAARGDDPLAVLERVVDRVECVHIADTAERGALRPTVIGSGVAPFDAIFRRLKQAGYDNWFSIEEASGCPDGIDRALDFFRRRWAAA